LLERAILYNGAPWNDRHKSSSCDGQFVAVSDVSSRSAVTSVRRVRPFTPIPSSACRTLRTHDRSVWDRQFGSSDPRRYQLTCQIHVLCRPVFPCESFISSAL